MVYHSRIQYVRHRYCVTDEPEDYKIPRESMSRNGECYITINTNWPQKD